MNVPSHARTGRLIPFVLALVALCAVVAGASGAVIAPEMDTYTIDGDTVDVPIIVDSLPNGCAGFKLTASFGTPGIGEINWVTFPTDVVITNWTKIDANSVFISAAFKDTALVPGSSGQVLATMLVRGNAAGSTTLGFSNVAIDDKGGFAIANTTSGATINVVNPSPPAPVANFEANVTSGPAPLTVRFTDLSTGAPYSQKSFDFGYLSPSNSLSATSWTRTYPNPGNYTVKLTLVNAGGHAEMVKESYIRVLNVTPTQTPVVTPTETPVVTPTETPVVTPTETPVVTPTETPVVTPTETPVVTPTETPVVTPTETPVVTPTETPVVTPTETPVVTPTETPVVTPTETPVVTPTETPVVTPTPTPVVTPETPGPFGGPHSPSTVIQAEDFDLGGEGVAYHDLEPANQGGAYRPSEGVDIETEGGITNVGWTRAGEYLKYSVDTSAAGTFNLVLRAANPDSTAKAVKVYLDGVPAGEVLVSGTGSWTVYRDFTGSAQLVIPTGRHVVTLAFEGVERLNLDWLSLTAGTPSTLPQTVPYGPGNNIPGRVQAENFDKNGNGAANAAYSDTTLANEGGQYRTSESVDIEYTAGIQSYNLGWIRSGEYVIYTVQVSKSGVYTAQFNAANPSTTAKAIDVYVDGAKVGTVQVGSTGSWATFKQFPLSLSLPAGTHQIKLAFPNDGLNLDYIEFGSGGVVTTTTTQGTVTGGSFVAAPTTAKAGTAFKFTVTPKAGKSIRSAWWSFDYPAHKDTWNSRVTNPTFYYYVPGTYSPYVELTYTDGTKEVIHKVNYIRST